MTTYAIEEQKLTNIADAIRSKTGGVDTLSVDEMATEIGNINTGVGEVSWNDLTDKPTCMETSRVTVECEANSEQPLEGFPLFNVGDTVAVIIDGVEHSLVAFDNGTPVIGEPYEELGDGEGLEWQIFNYEETVCFCSTNSHTVTYDIDAYAKIKERHLPDSVITSEYKDSVVEFVSLDKIFGRYDIFIYPWTTGSKTIEFPASSWQEVFNCIHKSDTTEEVNRRFLIANETFSFSRMFNNTEKAFVFVGHRLNWHFASNGSESVTIEYSDVTIGYNEGAGTLKIEVDCKKTSNMAIS